MNFVTIGDVHGRNKWKNAIYRINEDTGDIKHCYFDTTLDKAVFVGDYVDDYFLKNEEILNNLKEIIQLKKDYPDNVVLLWGNHDLAYLKGDSTITGFRTEMFPDLNQLFTENRKLFQFAYQHGDVLWTHAGVHRGWWNQYVQPIIDRKLITRFTDFLNDCKNTADYLNLMFEFNYEPLFMISHYRGGHGKVAGPVWADKVEIYTKPLENIHQVVGHNPVPNVKTYYFKNNTRLTFTDCMPVNDEFYKLRM